VLPRFIWSVCLLIMIDTLFLRTSHQYTCRHFTYSHLNFTHLHFTTLSFVLTLFKFRTAPFHFTSLHFTSQHFLDDFRHTSCQSNALHAINYRTISVTLGAWS